MKNFLSLSILAAIAYSCLTFSCAGSKKTTIDPYLGEWEYTFPMDGSEVEARMTINKIESEYIGSLSSEFGSVDLQDLKIEQDNLSARFEIDGYELTMKGTFNGEVYNGTTNYNGEEWPMNATKKLTED